MGELPWERGLFCGPALGGVSALGEKGVFMQTPPAPRRRQALFRRQNPSQKATLQWGRSLAHSEGRSGIWSIRARYASYWNAFLVNNVNKSQCNFTHKIGIKVKSKIAFAIAIIWCEMSLKFFFWLCTHYRQMQTNYQTSHEASSIAFIFAIDWCEPALKQFLPPA